MITLHRRSHVPQPRTGAVSAAAAYEWRQFIGTEAHLYRRDQLAADWPPMIRPWCEEDRPGSRRHERRNIGEERLAAPDLAARCRDCGHRLRAANHETLALPEGRT